MPRVWVCGSGQRRCWANGVAAKAMLCLGVPLVLLVVLGRCWRWACGGGCCGDICGCKAVLVTSFARRLSGPSIVLNGEREEGASEPVAGYEGVRASTL